MTKVFLPDKLTPLTSDEAIAATAIAFQRVLRRAPAPETLAILVAHTALECGQWKSLHCFNLGNIKGADPRTGLYTMYKCDERLRADVAEKSIAVDPAHAQLRSKNPDGTWTVWFLPPHVQTHFRAFRTAEDAFEDYVRFLFLDTTPDNGKPNKWHRAAAAAERGDLKGFVYGLYDPDGNPKTSDGYFTARPDVYYDGADGPGGRPGILALYDQFLPRCRQHLGISESEPPPTDPAPPATSSLLAQARGHFAAADEALRQGREVLDKLEGG